MQVKDPVTFHIRLKEERNNGFVYLKNGLQMNYKTISTVRMHLVAKLSSEKNTTALLSVFYIIICK
jgi:hypothetical protein